jgi:hypothetical protein
MSCITINRPEIIDENLYEIVGGTAKVLRSDLMGKMQRTALEIAARNFSKNCE